MSPSAQSTTSGVMGSNTGGVSSTIVMELVVLAVLPHSSSAMNVTVTVPQPLVARAAGSKSLVTVTSPQLSVAVTAAIQVFHQCDVTFSAVDYERSNGFEYRRSVIYNSNGACCISCVAALVFSYECYGHCTAAVSSESRRVEAYVTVTSPQLSVAVGQRSRC